MSAADPDLEHARILLVRTSSLGDVVHSLPVLGALRRHLPRAKLAWVVEEPFAPLLAGHPDLDQLTPREREVLRYIARGYAYKQVARELHISVKTVETHVSAVLRKLQLSSRHELTRWATDRRLV